jgi:hypothetical protein
MSSLVRQACKLRFEEHEFIEFFGIVSHLDENSCSYGYELDRDGLRLLFTVFPLDGGVYASIYRVGIAEPIITSRLEGCTHSRFVERGSLRWLEIGRPELPTSETSAPLVWGLHLCVEPHFRIEFAHENMA